MHDLPPNYLKDSKIPLSGKELGSGMTHLRYLNVLSRGQAESLPGYDIAGCLDFSKDHLFFPEPYEKAVVLMILVIEIGTVQK